MTNPNHNEINLQNKKSLLSFTESIRGASPENIADILKTYFHDDMVWHGPVPIGTLNGISEVADKFWKPFLTSFPDIWRRNDILFGDGIESPQWTASTGYITTVFCRDWLGIPATGNVAYIRFGEFCRFVDGKIKTVYILLDILDVMRQAGIRLLPPSLGKEGLTPPPLTGDGIVLEPQDEAESKKTLQLVEDMLFKGLMTYDGKSLDSMREERFWHPQMMWYGPSGIGTTRGIKGFQDFHQGPFLEAFPDRTGGHEDQARPAEGEYAATVGFPSLYATHTGKNWLGMPVTDKKITMSLMDFWRREGDLLVENWVLIDIIDILQQMGCDLFERMEQQLKSGRLNP